MAEETVIPDKPAFKSSEVCELLKLQPYVLKSWENEFKDLGVAKTAGGPRVYRRVDVQRAVRIRDLMLREGLTLAGVRRRLEQDAATADAEDDLIAEITAGTSAPATDKGIDRERVLQVKQGLRALLDTLSKPAISADPVAVESATVVAPSAPKASARRRARRGPEPAGPVDDRTVASVPPETVESATGVHSGTQVPETHEALPVVAAESAESADEVARSHAPVRELTVVADEAPSLFGDDEPVAHDESKQARRKRAPRAGSPPGE